MKNKIKRSGGYICFRSLSISCVIVFAVFTNCNDISGSINTIGSEDATKIDEAISCTPNGLAPADNELYMKGGGSEFSATIIDKQHQRKDVPAGMVWIPGGTFSMGGINPVGMHDGGNEAMNDARPVHRVQLKEFLMDATEVTNNEVAAFVKA